MAHQLLKQLFQELQGTELHFYNLWCTTALYFIECAESEGTNQDDGAKLLALQGTPKNHTLCLRALPKCFLTSARVVL